MGETYDARKAMPGWDAAGFDDSGWHPVDRGAELNPVVQWHPGPPVRAFAELKPKSITEPKPGDVRARHGPELRRRSSGSRRPASRAGRSPCGSPSGSTPMARSTRPTSARPASRIRTSARRRGEIDWEPRFTFHGFQYVEVTGLTSRPTEETITGIALSSDTPVVGSFACSDPMLNQLFSNIYWTQRANFIDIPTDCPQRDERLGWTGDAQVYIGTAALICDVQAFFTKWLVDLTDGQRADGQFPMVAPVKVAGDDGGPAWADAGVICPWTIYQVYGDRRVLERQYPSMVKFVEFCRKRSTPDLLPPKQFHCFGDWLSINADTPKDVIYTAYFAHSTLADGPGRRGAGQDRGRGEVSRALFDADQGRVQPGLRGPDGRIKGDTQACLRAGDRLRSWSTVDERCRRQGLRAGGQYLVEDIEKRGNHLSTGFIGTKSLMQALSKIGRHDVAFRLLHNDTFPSWGFSIKHGATSIWERWDGWTPEKGFQDPGMNSFAHYSFGAVYHWMVENIGGIRLASHTTLSIAPRIDPNLSWARTSYREPVRYDRDRVEARTEIVSSSR